MQNKFDESYKGNVALREPILSMMMWGPLDGYGMEKKEQRCRLDHHSLRTGSRICSKIGEMCVCVCVCHNF